MALKSKTNEEPTVEQISFDDIDFEAEYIDEEELEEMSTKKYYTISGKEQQYEPEWESFNVSELDVGVTMEGRPEITIFENEDKSYNAFRLRVMDDGEILNCYLNYPKKDYPYVKRINKGFDFYRPLFNFIYSLLRMKDEKNVVDANGEEVNMFNKINIEMLAKFVDQHERVGVKIIEGVNPDYNDWVIYKLE